jgi:Cu(I)/Ag(I) efflux system membrane protein CusA/SilA
MLTSIIRTVIRFRIAVVALVTALVAVSVYVARTAPLDAIPDISDPQIVIYAKWARSPELLETEVTEPLVRALIGAQGVAAVRATSHLGYSFVYVILTEPSQREAVRQLALDRINQVRPQLPSDAVVTLGPNASSMGWIFEYALVDREGTRDLRELRRLNESRIKPALQAVPGVAEVASVGGLERQVELKIFPPLLAETGLALRPIVTALQDAFQQVGGRTIELTNRDYQLRGIVETENLDDIEHLVVGRDTAGRTVRLKDIGYLQVTYDLRRGIADLDGEGEVVGGIVIKDQEQNVLAVSASLDAALDSITPSLPEGVEIVTTYDRSALIWATLKNFFTALGYELLVVMLVIVWALRSGRAAAAPVAVLLLGCLFTVLPLAALGQTINLLSLAGLAIAIGEMADATIVIVENCTTELAKRGAVTYAERIETIIHATARMTRPLLFSLLIILASFIPIFFLGEREGRLFDPLAYSKTFAMAFSTVLTLLVLPAIIVWVFKKKAPQPRGPEGAFVRGYRVALRAVIGQRYLFLGASAVLLVGAVVVMSGFQKDYMPEMEEGSILYMPTTLPGLPAREAGWILQQMDRKLMDFPEVERVFGKLGRADTSTDPAPMTMVETTILLKPESEWRDGLTKEELVAELDAEMQIVGFVNTWTQPIAARVIMQDTGIQSPVGIKVKGPDIAVIEELSQRIEDLLRAFPGTASVIAERISQGYFVDVRNDLARMAAHGVTVDEAALTVRYGVGGENVVAVKQADGTTVPLSMQYSPEYIDTLEKVEKTPVVTADGRAVPLGDVADVAVRNMPEMIRNDNGDLAGYIYIDLDGVTGTDYVAGARRHLANQLELPDGYSLEWTGTHRYAEEARARLVWIIPLTLLITFVLLMMTFRSLAQSTLIMFSAPFALVGGVLLQWTQGYAVTTAVIIGYIAVLAVAVQTGIIMIEFIRDALARRTERQSYIDAVIEGSVARLRPKLMTVATTVFGLIPIMLASGSGFDITQPIAAPSVGGMISSTIYVLFLIPCLFAIGDDFRRRRNRPSVTSAPLTSRGA